MAGQPSEPIATVRGGPFPSGSEATIGQLLDAAFGHAQGTILYRGATSWQAILQSGALDALNIGGNTQSYILQRGQASWNGVRPQANGFTMFANVQISGVPSTSGGGIASWQPTGALAVDCIVTRVVLYAALLSIGAANVSIGVAADAVTSSANLIDSLDVHTGSAPLAWDNIVNKGAGGQSMQLLPGGSFVTVTGSADTTLLTGNLLIQYMFPAPPS